MVFIEEDKTVIEYLYKLNAYNARQLRKEFRTKEVRQVAFIGCSISLETRAQWTAVRASADREVPEKMKTLTR